MVSIGAKNKGKELSAMHLRQLSKDNPVRHCSKGDCDPDIYLFARLVNEKLTLSERTIADKKRENIVLPFKLSTGYITLQLHRLFVAKLTKLNRSK